MVSSPSPSASSSAACFGWPQGYDRMWDLGEAVRDVRGSEPVQEMESMWRKEWRSIKAPQPIEVRIASRDDEHNTANEEDRKGLRGPRLVVLFITPLDRKEMAETRTLHFEKS